MFLNWKAQLMHNIENNEHLPDYISKSFERVNWKHIITPGTPIKATIYYKKLEWKWGKNQ